jgi:hypothetical protein
MNLKKINNISRGIKMYLEKIIKHHSELLLDNPYCYFELAYTRQTSWMIWVCSRPPGKEGEREVIVSGQGENPEEAAKNAWIQYSNKINYKKNDIIIALNKLIKDIDSSKVDILTIEKKRGQIEISPTVCGERKFVPAKDFFIELHLQNIDNKDNTNESNS